MAEMNRIKPCGLRRGLNPQSRITRVNYEPKFYVYDEAVGLFISWQVSAVYISSKVSHGLRPLQYEENGETRSVLRLGVVTWPELKYEPTPDVLAFLEKCEENGTLHAYINIMFPTLDEFGKIEKIAALLHYTRKIENGTENTHTIFALKELEDALSKPCGKIGGMFTRIFAKMGTRSLTNTSINYKQATAEHWGPRALRPGDIEEVRRCTKVVRRNEHGLYTSEYWPWLLFDADVRKPFWQLMHKAMGYKKFTFTSTTIDLDVEAYMELKNVRDVKFLEMQEMKENIRLSMLASARGI